MVEWRFRSDRFATGKRVLPPAVHRRDRIAGIRPGVGVLLVALLASACGSGTPSQEPAASGASTQPSTTPSQGSAAAPSGTVSWWTSLEGESLDKLKTNFEQPFEAAHPSIALEFTSVPANTALRTAIQAGKGPDIVSQDVSQQTRFVPEGFLAPLDAYAVKYGWRDEIQSWAYDVGTVDGKLYFLPETYEALLLFYNKKVFADAGLSVPTNRAEVEAVATQLKGKGIDPFANLDGIPPAAGQYLTYWAQTGYAGAAKVYAALKGDASWTDADLVASAALLADWGEKGWFSGSREAFASGDYDLMISNFASGKGAMLVIGTWAFGDLAGAMADHPDLDYDWVPLPTLRDGVSQATPIGIGESLAINAASTNKDAAAEVLDWVYSDPDRAANLISVMGGEFFVPITTLTEADFPADMDPRFSRALAAVAAAASAGDYSYVGWTFWGTKSADFLRNETVSLVTGAMSPDAWSGQLDKLFQVDVKDGSVPPLPPRR